MTGAGLVVEKAFRRRGIGTVLTHLWAEEVKSLGAEESVIATGTEPENPAPQIYFAMGYRQVDEFCSTLTNRL